MTRTLTLDAPNASLFAAVQVDVPDPEGRDGRRIVGAAPAFRMESRPTGRMIEIDGELVPEMEAIMVPLSRVGVDCHLEPGDTSARAVWAYEDATIPNEETDVQLDEKPAKTVGGLKVTR